LHLCIHTLLRALKAFDELWIHVLVIHPKNPAIRGKRMKGNKVVIEAKLFRGIDSISPFEKDFIIKTINESQFVVVRRGEVRKSCLSSSGPLCTGRKKGKCT